MKITMKAARVNAGLTQVEAAKLIGIGASTLIGWEQEPDRIPGYRQKQIADAYKMPIDNIIFLSDD